jgi:hypothetical protein
MPDNIDVRGLDEQDISLIEALVRRLRRKAGKEAAGEEKEVEKELVFATHHSNVIGKLTRKEIYEDL